MPIRSSYVLWKGPSRIDGSPLVVIVTGADGGSTNSKTGRMAQSYIIRSDVDPVEAVSSGSDYSMCGTCPARGKPILSGDASGPHVDRYCYVGIFRGPGAVYRAYKDGRYASASPADVGDMLANNDVAFRCGAYGDPMAVPLSVWKPIFNRVKSTGYTHQWARFRRLASSWSPWIMASADTAAEASRAQSLGWRTFRVASSNCGVPGEILCPASTEAGKKVTCRDCLLCGGTEIGAKSIYIPVHGNLAGNYKEG